MRETRDIDVRGVRNGLLIIAAGIAVSLVLASAVVMLSDVSPAGANGFAPPAIEGPALQVAPTEEQQAYVREKRALLERNGPVADAPGRRYLPIDRAMRRIAR